MLSALLLFLFAISIPASAQRSQPAFGKVDKTDMLMTDCDFDKGANAVTLIDYGSTYYDRGTHGVSLFTTIFERRTRIKILKEKGIAQADVEIPFYTHNNEERIFKLKANTYNIDESGKIITTEVKKSSIYKKKIDAYYSKMIIAFPDVKVGSIIEYSYYVERETQVSIRNWFFQERIPVRYSEYQLIIPQIFRFTVQPSVIDSMEEKKEVIDEIISADVGVVQTKSLKSNYIMHNLPGIKDEPFMSSPKDYMQRLEFQLTQIYYNNSQIVDISLKWKDVIKDLMGYEYFGLQLEKRIWAADTLIEEAKKIDNIEARTKFIFNKIRSSISWNGDEAIFTDNGISKTWDTKTGNSADINLLLIKLLTDAGIKATPVLFSTRNHGLTMPGYPYVNQFNSVMAYVFVNDKMLILDATDKFIDYKLVPEKVVNSNGFLIEGENGKWKEILSGKYMYKIMTAVQSEIDAAGNMKGDGLVNSYDYARVQRCNEWVRNKEKFKEDYFITPYPALKIEDFVINNVDADSLPLEQKVKFSSVLNSSGDYRYFSINLFSDLEKNPFVADYRVADVDFGVPQEYILFENFTIPLDYVFDGLPESIAMTTSDKSIIFNRHIQADGNLLNVRMTVEFKRPFYAASYYDEFAAFYKKLFEKLNEQVVIKKKTGS